MYYITLIYFIQNKYEKVVSEGEELLSSYPNSKNNSEVYRILGNSYYHLGNQDKATNMLSKYVEEICTFWVFAISIKGITAVP